MRVCVCVCVCGRAYASTLSLANPIRPRSMMSTTPYLLLTLLTLFASNANGCALSTTKYAVVLNEPGCTAVTKYMEGCSGHCTSSSITDTTGQISYVIKCCNPATYKDVEVAFSCNGAVTTKTYQFPASCTCQNCVLAS